MGEVAKGSWRDRAATLFDCEKTPAVGTRGMVVTNHPLASAAGAEMLAAGGNAVDGAVAALFTLTVVEPMMVGIFGGGMAHLRLADGRHTVIDGLALAPRRAAPDTYEPISDSLPDYLETAGRENAVGAKAVAVPGTLKAWCETLRRFGTFPLADVMAPAIRNAARGFRVTPYLSECVRESVGDLAADPEIARVFLPGGTPIEAGARLVSGDYAETLRAIAKEGEGALHGGALGRAVADRLEAAGCLVGLDDLTHYRTVERAPVRGTYRGFEVLGPPPPSSAGVHIIEMLNVLEGFELGALGFGAPATLHLVAEALKLAFADRKAVTADPDFAAVPVDRLISKGYGHERRGEIDPERARDWDAGLALPQSPNTTHVTVADGEGNIVASTQTINSTFGARIMVPGTGIIPNNYMRLFDPHPGHTQSIAPGKRVTTSQAPVMVLRDGRPVAALGLPGGLRIFGAAMQAIVNVIDHGMTLQEAVEAPRIWTQGGEVEIEDGFPEGVRSALAGMGHDLAVVATVGGGMNAVSVGEDGVLTGAACWRADGTPIALSGGLARRGVRFWPDQPGRR